MSAARVMSARPSAAARAAARCIAAPERRTAAAPVMPTSPAVGRPKDHAAAPLVSVADIKAMEAELDAGASMAALRRFNAGLLALCGRSEADVAEVMRPVWNELAYNLESFNPIFTAALLKVQCTLGASDYERRDASLKNLIQPLAGEYGLHESEAMGKTHRQLFADFYQSCTGEPLQALLDEERRPRAAELLFSQMLRDVSTGGGASDPLEGASYALGYNLAVEYLAQYEKGWMLDSFKALAEASLAPAGREVDWLFLEVHAEGEPEHAHIGHDAVAAFVPAAHSDALRRAMRDHDRDFADFYNCLADALFAGAAK